MPRFAREWTDAQIRALKHSGRATKAGQLVPEKHAVGGVRGLMVQVTPTGSKSWILSVERGSGESRTRRMIGLGSYPDVSLKAAREAARSTLARVNAGVDVITERKEARAQIALKRARSVTFREVAEAFLATMIGHHKSDKHKAQWVSTVRSWCYPVIGDLPVSEVGVEDVLRVLQQDVEGQPFWTARSETARRVQQRLEKVLGYARIRGHAAGDNPASWRSNLELALPKVKRGEHHPAVAIGDVARWFRAVRGRNGSSARCLEFTALTVGRSSETRGCRWDELDFDHGVWRIPASRMKASRPHTVALSAAAVELLENAPRLSELVFPAPRGGELSDMALTAVARKIHEADDSGFLDPATKRPAVVHGLRSTFRSWAAEAGWDHHLCEIALAHAVGSATERAYQRSDMLARRFELMEAWARVLTDEPAGVVVEFRRG